MIAKREVWKYKGNENVWVGKYKNSHNILHWHYDCELLYVEQGKIDVFCEREKYTLQSGDALFIDSGCMHYMQAQDPETLLAVIVFDYDNVKPYLGHYALSSPLLTKDYNIKEIYAKLKKELTEKNMFYDAVLSCEIQKLVIEIFRSEEITTRMSVGGSAQAFKRLLCEINEKYEFYTFNDASKFIGMSPAYFSRFFRAMSGMTFSQYLNYVKIDNAIRLLSTDKTLQITEVAIRCGFSTIRNFNRIFKDLTGYQPKRLPEGYSFNDKFARPIG